MDPSYMLEQAGNLAARAVKFDRDGHVGAAVYCYRTAASWLDQAIGLGRGNAQWEDRSNEYKKRADTLESNATSDRARTALTRKKSDQQKDLERAYFLLSQGLDEDTNGNSEEAISLYSEAVELCLGAKKATDDKILQDKLVTVAKQALERAEQLKGVEAPSKPKEDKEESSDTPTPLPPKAEPQFNQKASRLHRGFSQHLEVSGSDSYSKEELLVLRKTSLINGREYVPFMTVDLKEKFACPVPFTDKEGKLPLAPKQQRVLRKWARPDELMEDPKMIEVIDSFSIKQTVVSDCSFVASLAISALYEKRYKKRLITSIIYPRNSKGNPVYNPCGKYMVRLHLNGVARKVVVDDLLPLGADGQLLCSHSTNRNELWVSILEKAYMKVMGGYDFPGSNSNIDLHALTGWIPERSSIKVGDPAFNSDGLFKKLFERFHKGDVLVTLATGNIPEAEADRAGLVPTHAYAMLDIREVQGTRLLMLKNPWSHLRWKGNYSELDIQHWTKELREALHYDPDSASQFDNGVFWIDYDSILHFFDVAYLNWNPALFSHTYCIHQCWHAGKGPTKDLYTIGDNPQFSLNIQCGDKGGAVWILLTRHITDIRDFRDNQEYITILVYKNEGKKVYYPNDPPPYIDGVRINSPHYLCKVLVSGSGTHRFTLVVSQYEKSTTIYYTVRAYSTCPFALSRILNPFTYKQEVTNGKWEGTTAGGCANNPATYPNNPRYQITMDSSTDNNRLLITLKGPKQYQMGFDVVTVVTNNSNAPGSFAKKSSGPFRSGFVIIELEDVPCGTYNIIPSTFLPRQEGPFFLTVESTCPLKMNRIQ